MAAVLAKPFSPAQLVAAVRGAIAADGGGDDGAAVRRAAGGRAADRLSAAPPSAQAEPLGTAADLIGVFPDNHVPGLLIRPAEEFVG